MELTDFIFLGTNVDFMPSDGFMRGFMVEKQKRWKITTFDEFF